jgi:hypothetical protein
MVRLIHRSPCRNGATGTGRGGGSDADGLDVLGDAVADGELPADLCVDVHAASSATTASTHAHVNCRLIRTPGTVPSCAENVRNIVRGGGFAAGRFEAWIGIRR